MLGLGFDYSLVEDINGPRDLQLLVNRELLLMNLWTFELLWNCEL